MVATLNKCIIYDKDFTSVSETVLDKDKDETGVNPASWPNELRGVEDVKLMQCGDNIMYTGTMGHTDRKIGCAYGRYDQNNTTGLNPTELKRIDDACEKNWIFIPNDKLQMVYKWHPLQIGQIEDGALTIIKTSHMPKLFSMARGSTNGFRCGDEIWFVVHFVHQWQNEPRFYYHAVAIFDGEMEYKKCTYPFKFSDKPIEYCLGLVVEEDRIIFGRSVYDKDAALKIVHKKTFLDKYLME